MIGSINSSFTINGQTFVSAATTDYPTANQVGVTLAAAKTGTLTTRTDANTGTLTMEADHGITTGQRLDIFWLDADGVTTLCQYKVTAGTVATNSVPIDLGVGDDLPIATTAVIVQVPTEINFLLEADVVDVVGISANSPCKVVLEEADGTVVLATTIQSPATAYVWYAASGITSPIAEDVAKAFISNSSSVAAILVNVAAASTL